MAKKKLKLTTGVLKKLKDLKRQKSVQNLLFHLKVKRQTKDYKYHVGDKITIKVDSVADTPDGNITLNYEVKSSKKFGIFDGIKFERQK